MNAPSPALLPLFRSQAQGELLALLFLNPDHEYSLTDVARHTGSSVPTVHAEVNRLMAAGLTKDRRVGNVRLVRADMDAPQGPALRELLAVSYGPRPVIARALASQPGVDQVYIAGAWAQRQEGRSQSVPDEVSVIVVGAAAPSTLRDAQQQAESALECDVRLRQVSKREWDQAVHAAGRGQGSTSAADDDLVAVAQGPLISVLGPRPAATTPMAASPSDAPTTPSHPPFATQPETPAAIDGRPAPTSSPTSTASSAERGCPLLELGPAVGRCITSVVAGLPQPPSPSSIAGTVVSATRLGWLPWSAFPLRLVPLPPMNGPDD